MRRLAWSLLLLAGCAGEAPLVGDVPPVSGPPTRDAGQVTPGDYTPPPLDPTPSPVRPDAARPSEADAGLGAQATPDAAPADCAEGEGRPCPGCPAGRQPCVGGAWGACQAPLEICDGEDQDCDGEVDEGCGCVGLADCPAGRACEAGSCVAVAPCEGDPLEPNDAQAAAHPLPPGAEVEAGVCPGDTDWYVVEVCAGGTLTVRLRFSHAQGDIDVALTDATGAPLASGAPVDDDEEVSLRVPRGGAVFVHVMGLRGAQNGYRMSVEVAGCGAPAPCEDDEHEPDGAAAQAVRVQPGSPWAGQLCAGDEDWVLVSVCAGGQLRVDLRFDGLAGDLDAALVDAQGRVLDAAQTRGDDEHLLHGAARAEDVWVRIYGADPQVSNAYLISVQIEGCAAPCVDDEDEENDTAEAATPIGPGARPHRVRCAGDDDWYVVDTCPGGRLIARLDFAHAAGDLALSVFNGAELVARADGAADVERVEIPTPAGGPRLLRVDGQANDYELSVALAGCGCAADADCGDRERCVAGACEGPPPCEDDRLEEDDVRADAVPLGLGGALDRRICPDDEDWFAVSVCGGGVLTVDLTFIDADGDLDLELLSAEGRRLGGVASVSDDEHLRWTAGAADETVYLRVYGFLGARNDYSISARVAGCGGAAVCQDDRFEDNDRQDQASATVPGTLPALTVCPQDDDWYVIALCAGGTLRADLRFSHAAGDLDAALLGDAAQLLALSGSVSDDEHLRWTAGPAQRVWVHVYGVLDATNDYQLDLAVEGCAGGPLACVDDAFEPNDAQAEAAPLAPDFLGELALCPDDEDWFEIPLCAGGLMSAEATFSHADGDLDLILWVDGAVARASISRTDDELVEYESAVDVMGYVQVVNFAGDPNDYLLEVVQACP